MKKIVGIMTTMALSWSVISCGNNNSQQGDAAQGGVETKGHTVPELFNDLKAERPSMFLRFTDSSQTDSSVVYIAKALNQQDTVALTVEVKKEIPAGIINKMAVESTGFTTGTFKFKAVGAQGEAFLKALQEGYKLPLSGKVNSAAVVPTVFSSNEQAVDLSSKNTYSFKFFFNDTSNQPAEYFAVLDLYKNGIELTEKDSTHRAGLVQAFQE